MPEAVEAQEPLRLGRREFGPHERLVMAIVNRTPDSFYDRGATWLADAAFARVEKVVADGADIVDIGGVKAGAGDDVSVAEEIDRVASFVERVRRAHPDLVISVDTYRADVGRAVCDAGADLLNDPWGGHDPRLAEVAAEYGAGLVCAHAGGLDPRRLPYRVEYDDVVGSVVAEVLAEAERTAELGVRRDGIVVDPAHDFGKTTAHSLEITRRIDELVATGWPVLVSLSNKDFVGETLDAGVGERLTGTLAATAVCAWSGARIFRVHDAAATRETLDMVSSIQGHRPPARAVRGLT